VLLCHSSQCQRQPCILREGVCARLRVLFVHAWARGGAARRAPSGAASTRAEEGRDVDARARRARRSPARTRAARGRRGRGRRDAARAQACDAPGFGCDYDAYGCPLIREVLQHYKSCVDRRCGPPASRERRRPRAAGPAAAPRRAVARAAERRRALAGELCAPVRSVVCARFSEVGALGARQ